MYVFVLLFYFLCFRSTAKLLISVDLNIDPRIQKVLLWKYKRKPDVPVGSDLSLVYWPSFSKQQSQVGFWISGARGAGVRAPTSAQPLVPRDARSTMLETKFSSAKWISLTKPEPGEVQNITFSHLAPINFSLLPLGLSEYSAFAITSLS